MRMGVMGGGRIKPGVRESFLEEVAHQPGPRGGDPGLETADLGGRTFPAFLMPRPGGHSLGLHWPHPG